MLKSCLWALLVLLSVNAVAFGSDSVCSQDVPANVVFPNGTLIRNMNASNFVARSKSGVLPIQSLESDTDSRRIIFVVATGELVPEMVRTSEARVLADMLSKARPQDSFALLTARGPRIELRFGTSRDALSKAFDEIAEQPKGKSQPGADLDAVLESISWFGQPQTGDAIVILTTGIEFQPRASSPKVQRALDDSRVRLFGFQFAPIAGQITSSYYQVDGPWLVQEQAVDTNEQSVFALSDATGGFVVDAYRGGGPLWTYNKLTADDMKFLSDMSEQEYKAVTDYYRIRLEAPSGGLKLDLSDTVHAQFPTARVTYPKTLPACPSVASTRP